MYRFPWQVAITGGRKAVDPIAVGAEEEEQRLLAALEALDRIEQDVTLWAVSGEVLDPPAEIRALEDARRALRARLDERWLVAAAVAAAAGAEAQPRNLVCGSWEIRVEGIPGLYRREPGGQSVAVMPAAPVPLLRLAAAEGSYAVFRLVNRAGTGPLVVAGRDRAGHDVCLDLPGSAIPARESHRAALAQLALELDGGAAPRVAMTDRLGWVGKRSGACLVMGSGSADGAVRFRPAAGLQWLEAYRPFTRGDPDEWGAKARETWAKVLAPAVREPAVLAAFGHAVASLVLASQSTRAAPGRTLHFIAKPPVQARAADALLRLVASAFGDADRLVRNWEMSRDAAQRTLHTMRHVPGFLGGYRTRAETSAANVLEMVARGQGKTLATGTRECRLNLLSWGEHALPAARAPLPAALQPRVQLPAYDDLEAWADEVRPYSGYLLGLFAAEPTRFAPDSLDERIQMKLRRRVWGTGDRNEVIPWVLAAVGAEIACASLGISTDDTDRAVRAMAGAGGASDPLGEVARRFLVLLGKDVRAGLGRAYPLLNSVQRRRAGGFPGGVHGFVSVPTEAHEEPRMRDVDEVWVRQERVHELLDQLSRREPAPLPWKPLMARLQEQGALERIGAGTKRVAAPLQVGGTRERGYRFRGQVLTQTLADAGSYPPRRLRRGRVSARDVLAALA